MGYYIDRVVEPIKRHNPDRLYIVVERDPKEDKAEPFRAKVLRELSVWKPDLDVKIVPISLWDVDDAVDAFSSIIKAEMGMGNHVWVNLSTGSKLEAVAATLACMAYGATPYYVRMKSYEAPRPSTPLAQGVVAIDVVPTYGLAALGESQLALLRTLDSAGKALSKGSLIKVLDGNGNLQTPNGNIETHKTLTAQAKHGRLQKIMEPLLALPRFVDVEGRRSSARVSITPRGRLALRIFDPTPVEKRVRKRQEVMK